jgi:uncharacterized protein
MADSRNEPSMDEILSSIKKIIADDDRIKKAAPKTAAKPAAVPTSQAEPTVIEETVLELTEAVEMDNETSDLLDDSKAQSLARSFSTLQTLAEPGATPQIVRSGETSLEGLTRELLRPMLKEWLDTNLPPIVEAMVEREIARITKKG